MFGMFKKDPVKKLQKQHEELLAKAMLVQRSGDLKAYAAMIKEAEALEDRIADLEKQKG
ncbi:MAG: DUF6435 family protein [Bacteroidota bacterium]